MGHAANLALTRALGLSYDNINKVSELFVKDVFNSLPKAERAAGLNALRGRISKLKKYAQTKTETLSEAINDYVANGENATAFSKALVNQIEGAISGKEFLTKHILSKDYSQLRKQFGFACLDGVTARKWYQYHEVRISTQIESTLSLAERTKRAVQLRAKYWEEALDLVQAKGRPALEQSQAFIAAQSIPLGEYNLTINKAKQARHIEGTSEYSAYVNRAAPTGFKPSKLAAKIDAQELVNKYHGKGLYDPNPRDGSIRERVQANKVIGQYWDKAAGQYVDTDWFEIVYSKTGTHIFPTYPPKEV